ncbi:MAG: 1-phosphofructokinase family hexose kinase [Mycoplasmataceae bacterium]|nr:1-phosphofructokinase family hexose kinase [Mycoplasmataceae bacterium]
MKLNLKNIQNKKILTVTLNPAIDKHWSVSKLTIGAVNRIQEVNDSAGGKGLNEARALHQLKLNVCVTGILAGQNGMYLTKALDQEGIKHHFYQLSHGQTRICINANNCKTHQITEMLEPGPVINKLDAQKFLIFFKKIVKNYDIVSLAGSLPQGLNHSYYSKLINICHQQKISVFLDTSGQALINNLTAKPNFVKPNIDEIRQLLGCTKFTKSQAIAFAKKWNQKGIKNFVISLGSEGALLVTSTNVYHAIPPKHPVVNTVGCGDTLVAGFIAAELAKVSPIDKISFATGLATNASTTKGTTEINFKILDKCWPKIVSL